jgi:hypothetical protein
MIAQAKRQENRPWRSGLRPKRQFWMTPRSVLSVDGDFGAPSRQCSRSRRQRWQSICVPSGICRFGRDSWRLRCGARRHGRKRWRHGGNRRRSPCAPKTALTRESRLRQYVSDTGLQARPKPVTLPPPALVMAAVATAPAPQCPVTELVQSLPMGGSVVSAPTEIVAPSDDTASGAQDSVSL